MARIVKPLPMRVYPLLPLLTLLAACAPDKVAPVPVMAMVISNTGQYEPREVALSTVEDVVALSGTAARLVGGARIEDDSNDPLRANDNLTEEQLRQILVKSEGLPPRASYVERAGVLWPADFHTWNMVSTYYNFEKAYLYFQDNGVTVGETLDPRTGAGPTVYYFPSLSFQGRAPLEDNALFHSPMEAFAILPFKELQAVPLSMNGGVVAHEFAHRVFSQRVYGGASIPIPFQTSWVPEGGFTTPGTNLVKSIDEGLADYHAYGVSCGSSYGCTTRFLEPSVGAFAADARDFSDLDRCMDLPLRNAISGMHVGDFGGQGLDYRLGTLLATALHKAAGSTKRQTMQRALLAAYNDESGSSPGLRQLVNANAASPGNFTLAAVAVSILQHISDPDLKIETCNAFIDHLQIPKADMIAPAGVTVACPAESANNGTCPNING